MYKYRWYHPVFGDKAIRDGGSIAIILELYFCIIWNNWHFKQYKYRTDLKRWKLASAQCPVLEHLEQSGHLGYFDICVILDIFGPFWATLDYFGPFWTILDYLGPFWNISNHFWPFKKFRAILDHFGLLWTIWTTLDHFGPFGTLWTS